MSRTLLVQYVLIDADTSHNVLFRRTWINALGAIVSMLHITMKFPNPNGDIITIKANKMEAQECYAKTLPAKPYIFTSEKHTKAIDINNVGGVTPISLVEFDPRKDKEDERPIPIEELCLF